MQLQTILHRCNESQPLTDPQLKQMFTTFTFFIQQIVTKISSIDDDQKCWIEEIKNAKGYIDEKVEKFGKEIRDSLGEFGLDVRKFVAAEMRDVKLLELRVEEIERSDRLDTTYKFCKDLQTKMFQKLRNEAQTIKKYFQQKLSNLHPNLPQPSPSSSPSSSLPPQLLKLYQTQINQFSNQLSTQLSDQITNTNIVNEISKNTDKNINARLWVDPQCCDFGNFRFEVVAPEILMVEKESCVFGKEPVKNIYELTLQNKKSVIRGVGVIDATYNSLPITEITPKPNKIWYEYTGCLQSGPNLQKVSTQGYNEGSLIKMTINLNSGSIQWRTSSHTTYKTSYQKLKDRSIKWVPVIVMSYYQRVWLKEMNNC